MGSKSNRSQEHFLKHFLKRYFSNDLRFSTLNVMVEGLSEEEIRVLRENGPADKLIKIYSKIDEQLEKLQPLDSDIQEVRITVNLPESTQEE